MNIEYSKDSNESCILAFFGQNQVVMASLKISAILLLYSRIQVCFLSLFHEQSKDKINCPVQQRHLPAQLLFNDVVGARICNLCQCFLSMYLGYITYLWYVHIVDTYLYFFSGGFGLALKGHFKCFKWYTYFTSTKT